LLNCFSFSFFFFCITTIECSVILLMC
jgi:hypothetical protein